MIHRFSPISNEQAAELVAEMLESMTGEPVRVVKWIRGSKFKIERYTGSEWVKG
jgi:hypothetical protein